MTDNYTTRVLVSRKKPMRDAQSSIGSDRSRQTCSGGLPMRGCSGS